MWRCPTCDQSVAKAIIRNGGHCPRPGCEQAGPPFESTCERPIRGDAIRCYAHGGNTRQALAKTEERAALRRAEGELGKLLAEMGEQPVPHPLDGLEHTYAKAGQVLAALSVLVAELDSPLGINRFGEHVVHPLVGLLGEWVDRYAKVQKVTLDAGLDERRQALDEGDVTALLDAMKAEMAAAGLTSAQQEAIGRGIADRIRSAERSLAAR